MVSVVYFEDDALSRQVMALTLKMLVKNVESQIFEDSTDFLGRLQTLPSPPDLIFVDIHMQPHNGFQVLKGIRAEERYHTSRVVALTASVMNEEVKLLREAGFDGVIGKPIDAGGFPDLVQRILAGEKVWRPT
ncbi:MAG: response regulator [Anaerolineae bacterium]